MESYDRGAWTLEEKQFWEALQDEMNVAAHNINAACNANITAGYVRDSYHGRLTHGGTYGMEEFERVLCNGMTHVVGDLCNEGPTAREAVATQVHAVECEYGPTTHYTLANGVFHATINPTDTDQYATYTHAAMDVLKKSL